MQRPPHRDALVSGDLDDFINLVNLVKFAFCCYYYNHHRCHRVHFYAKYFLKSIYRKSIYRINKCIGCLIGFCFVYPSNAVDYYDHRA